MNNLRRARFFKGMTQFQLRVATGIHQSKLSMLENGLIEPREEEKEKLAKVLKTPARELFPPKNKPKGETVLTQEKKDAD